MTLEDEVAEAMFGFETLRYMREVARRVSPGDDLPDGLKWEMREGQWWIFTEDGETGVGHSCQNCVN